MKNKLSILLIALSFAVLPKPSFAATISISPSSGSFALGSQFTVTVRANTQGEAANTAEASITYSTDTLELVKASQGATFYLPAPGSPNKGSGTAYFGGGLPTPGYTGTNGVIGTATFRAKALGTGTVSVSTGKVLLNDGSGTNALNSTSGATFTITPAPVGGPVVSSSTHPDPEGWYDKNGVELSWSRPTDAYGFSFELDQSEDTIPDNTLDTTITTSKKYEDLKDGIWYFHIKARGQSPSSAFGPATHFRIGVDTTAPEKFTIKLTGENDIANSSTTPSVAFETTDAVSGIDRYEISLDSKVIADKATSPFAFAKISAGDHKIKVVAYDKAGNTEESEIGITVTQEVAQGFFKKNLQLPLYALLIGNLLILLLIALLMWLVLRRRHKHTHPEDEIAAIQAEVDESLEMLKQNINAKLRSLSSKQSKELYESEEKVASAVNVKVNKTKKMVDKKMGRLSKKIKKQNDKVLE